MSLLTQVFYLVHPCQLFVDSASLSHCPQAQQMQANLRNTSPVTSDELLLTEAGTFVWFVRGCGGGFFFFLDGQGTQVPPSNERNVKPQMKNQRLSPARGTTTQHKG